MIPQFLSMIRSKYLESAEPNPLTPPVNSSGGAVPTHLTSFVTTQQACFMFSFFGNRKSLVELTLLGSISLDFKRCDFAMFSLFLERLVRQNGCLFSLWQSVILPIFKGKSKGSGRKRADFMNVHCWEGLEMIDKSMCVIFCCSMKPNVGKSIDF